MDTEDKKEIELKEIRQEENDDNPTGSSVLIEESEPSGMYEKCGECREAVTNCFVRPSRASSTEEEPSSSSAQIIEDLIGKSVLRLSSTQRNCSFCDLTD